MTRNTVDVAEISIRLEIQKSGMVMYRTLFRPIRSASLPSGMAQTMDDSADPVTMIPRMNSLAPLI